MKRKVLIIIAFVLFIQSFIQTVSASTIILGSGVNITDGTIIRLSGLNCNITVTGDYSVSKLEVYSDYFLINVPLTAPTYINLPYSYDSTTKIINITCTANTTPNLYINSHTPDGYSCTAASQCTNGYCVHRYCRSSSIYCGDGYCDSGESCSSCSSDCGACYVFPSVIQAPGKAEIELSSITTSIPKTVDVEGTTDFTELYIAVVKRVVGVKITIDKLDQKPAEVVEPDVGVYSYIIVETENIEDEDIDEARIKFKVEKSWVVDNSINESTVSLNRFVDNQWNKLPTNRLSEDDDYIHYEAEAPGFSYFAITGEKTMMAPTECPICPGPTNWSDCIELEQSRTNYRCSVETNYTCEEYTEIKSCEMPKKIKPGYVLLAFVLIALFLFLTIRKR